jgi:glucosamine--fructose-6-phosphate aminotransferase (isomerizing)
MRKILSEITGSSAFAFISSKDGKIIAAKKGSPLVFGIGKNAYYISSDVPSLIDYTNKFIFLADGDIVQFSSNGYKIENVFKRLKHRIETIDSHGIRYDLGDFDHFMEKEIFDQFKIWDSYKSLDDSLFEKISNILKTSRRIYIVGSGSSYYTSLYGAYLFRDAGLDALAIEPQQMPNYSKIINGKDVFFIVSQSGETYDIINVLEYIKNNVKIGLINVIQSSLARSVDIAIPMNVGTERAVAATKSVSASLITFIILYSKLINKKTYEDMDLLLNNRFNIYVPSIENLVNKVSEILRKSKDVFIVARNEDYPIALEGALKLKEVSYINANAIDMTTLKHGPLALITDGSLIIAVVSPGAEKDAINNLEELKSRGSYIIGISTTNMPQFDLYIRTVNAGIFYPLPILFIFQILAYKTSIKKGLDPDKPRNLAKSVTVK